MPPRLRCSSWRAVARACAERASKSLVVDDVGAHMGENLSTSIAKHTVFLGIGHELPVVRNRAVAARLVDFAPRGRIASSPGRSKR